MSTHSQQNEEPPTEPETTQAAADEQRAKAIEDVRKATEMVVAYTTRIQETKPESSALAEAALVLEQKRRVSRPTAECDEC